MYRNYIFCTVVFLGVIRFGVGKRFQICEILKIIDKITYEAGKRLSQVYIAYKYWFQCGSGSSINT